MTTAVDIEAAAKRLRDAQTHLEYIEDSFIEGRASQVAVADAWEALGEAQRALETETNRRDRR